MGSSTSIGIKFTSPEAGQPISPGTTVSGTVYLSCTKQISATVLQLAVVGREVTAVRYTHTSGSGKNKKRTNRTAHGQHCLFLLRWDLAKFPDGEVQVGQYEFPFAFQLPAANLPSTFCQSQGRSRCAVQYFLEARLSKPGWLTWDAVAYAPFAVVGLVPLVKSVEPTFIECHVPVTVCCCIGKGSMDLKVAINKDAAVTGEPLEVLYEARNNTSVDVQAVNVKLVEYVYWTAGAHAKASAIPLEQIMPSQKLNEGEKVIALEEDAVTMVVPKTFRADYRGNLVSCSHWLEVTLATKFGITNPTVRVPLRIYDQFVVATVLGVVVPGEEDNNEAAEEGEPEEDTNALPVGETVLPSNWMAVVAAEVVLDNAAAVESIENTNAAQEVSVVGTVIGAVVAGEEVEMPPL